MNVRADEQKRLTIHEAIELSQSFEPPYIPVGSMVRFWYPGYQHSNVAPEPALVVRAGKTLCVQLLGEKQTGILRYNVKHVSDPRAFVVGDYDQQAGYWDYTEEYQQRLKLVEQVEKLTAECKALAAELAALKKELS